MKTYDRAIKILKEQQQLIEDQLDNDKSLFEPVKDNARLKELREDLSSVEAAIMTLEQEQSIGVGDKIDYNEDLEHDGYWESKYATIILFADSTVVLMNESNHIITPPLKVEKIYDISDEEIETLKGMIKS